MEPGGNRVPRRSRSCPDFSGGHGWGAARRGFTLVELLIASFLAIIMAGFMFTVLSEQQRSAKRNDRLAEMQEQLRFATQQMARQIRMTGFGVSTEIAGSRFEGWKSMMMCDGCGEYNADADISIDGQSMGDSSDATGTDQLLILFRSPAREFKLDNHYYEQFPTSCLTSTLNAEPRVNLVSGDNEPLTLSSGEVISCFDESTMKGGTALAWTVNSDVVIGAFDPDADPDQYYVIPVLPNESAYFLARCGENIPYRMTCGSLKGGVAGFYLHNDTLWMDDDGDSVVATSPALSLAQAEPSNTNDIPLAHGVEDFQLAFCLPYDAPYDSTSEAAVAANLQDCLENPEDSERWLQPSTLISLPDALPYVRAVRLTLVVRGAMDRSGRALVSERPAVENHAPDDNNLSRRFPRMVQSMVVQLPNYRFQQGFSREFFE